MKVKYRPIINNKLDDRHMAQYDDDEDDDEMMMIMMVMIVRVM